MRIKLLWVGKTRNTAIKSLIADYLEKIGHLVPCEIVEARDLSRSRSLPVAQLIESEGNELSRHLTDIGRLVALDEKGSQFSSVDFAHWLEKEQDHGTRLITFIIGGPQGLSPAISGRAHHVLSLGKMTWTHEVCRVLIMEQIYRAFCIMRNIPYHKGRN
jgi:23S rRNA (pseudouridine1915-N3)-methyltransferase